MFLFRCLWSLLKKKKHFVFIIYLRYAFVSLPASYIIYTVIICPSNTVEVRCLLHQSKLPYVFLSRDSMMIPSLSIRSFMLLFSLFQINSFNSYCIHLNRLLLSLKQSEERKNSFWDSSSSSYIISHVPASLSALAIHSVLLTNTNACLVFILHLEFFSVAKNLVEKCLHCVKRRWRVPVTRAPSRISPSAKSPNTDISSSPPARMANPC